MRQIQFKVAVAYYAVEYALLGGLMIPAGFAMKGLVLRKLIYSRISAYPLSFTVKALMAF